jgi:C4-dicarboxylate-specific signal transduction histidine kinase
LESEKSASLGDMISNIAHQWRQPLSNISIIASGMCMKYDYKLEQKEVDIINNLEEIINNTEELSQIIDVFRNFINSDKSYKKSSLQESMSNALFIVNAALKQNNITVTNSIEYSKVIKLFMVEGELSQVIINILNNSKDALISKNITDKHIKIALNIDKKKAIIAIEDNAGGIDEEILGKIYEPYFTTKHQSNGTGLGLHISHKIVRDSFNGLLHAKNTNDGVKFLIELPMEKRVDDRRTIAKLISNEGRQTDRRSGNQNY